MTLTPLDEMVRHCSVSFGTSGVRGTVVEMTDRICYAYTLAFLQFLATRPGPQLRLHQVAIAQDLRPSSPRIALACAQAVRDFGMSPVNLGTIPSPALAFWGMNHQVPSIMVTGSHIPDDRNGIKFNTADGEILKADELGIRAQTVPLEATAFDTSGALLESRKRPLPDVDETGLREYLQRYCSFFPGFPLHGMRVAVYQHSSVARDLLVSLLESLGAQTTLLGRSRQFIPVDTEAIREEDQRLAQEWARSPGFDAIVSTDGDADRPLIGDETGTWMRGDVVGALCGHILGCTHIVTPVSSNTLVERMAVFKRVLRTRIGSPYVIEGMQKMLSEEPTALVGGYEANGGFLLQSRIERPHAFLEALPTRDAVLPIIGLLIEAWGKKRLLSSLIQDLPLRFTASGRLKDFPPLIAQEHIARFNCGDIAADLLAFDAFLGKDFSPALAIDRTDGVRVTLQQGEIVHLRPSGNAPELRAYCEADSSQRVAAMVEQVLQRLSLWRENTYSAE